MKQPHIRKLFPGAVTANGFYSHYNYIIEPNAEHIFVIKGGPGVGKSTFMKKIAQSMLEKGYDLEYHCCSSDNNSIDGIVIPELGIALLDGTAPHIVDPKNPGAVDEIINLGEYWNEQVLKQSKENIMRCNYLGGRYFKAAYFALQEAKIALEEWDFYISEYQNWQSVNELYFDVEQKTFQKRLNRIGRERHSFAWGHTPQGKTQFIDTLLNGINTLYTLDGSPGSGKSTFLKKIAAKAVSSGYNIELFHNTLNPEELDLIIIPDLNLGFVITSEPYDYEPNFEGTIINLDFDQFVNYNTLNNYKDMINDCRVRVNRNIERAIKNSSMAKETHDLMETYYIPAMDFKAIDEKREEVLNRIVNYTEHAIAVSSKTNTPI